MPRHSGCPYGIQLRGASQHRSSSSGGVSRHSGYQYGAQLRGTSQCRQVTEGGMSRHSGYHCGAQLRGMSQGRSSTEQGMSQHDEYWRGSQLHGSSLSRQAIVGGVSRHSGCHYGTQLRGTSQSRSAGTRGASRHSGCRYDTQLRGASQCRSVLKCLYTNADQLVNKRDDLCMAIVGQEPDVILITEVIPKAQSLPIDVALLSIPGFSIFCSFDPSKQNLGKSGIRGICVYVREGIQAAQVRLCDPQLTEHIWLQFQLRGADKLLVGCIYRSPSVDPHQSVDELAQLLQAVQLSGHSHLLITGDFNIPQIDWSSSFCSASESHHAHKFLAAVQDCLLFQHVTKPTRFRDGETPNVLGLVLTNEEGMLNQLQYSPGLGKSDHVVLTFELACYTIQSVGKLRRFNFHRADFKALNRKVSDTDWDSLLSSSVDEGYSFLRDTLDCIVSSCIPVAHSRQSRKSIYMTSKALKLRKLKNELWQRCAASKDPIDMARFRLCRNKLRKMTRQLRRQFEIQLVADVKANPKAFWRYSNSRMKTKPKIGDLRDATGQVVSDAELKAGVLNTFFASVFTHENADDVPCLPVREVSSSLTDVHISPGVVEQKLSHLKVACAPGPDDLHPRILKEAHRTLSVPLAYLYRRSLDTGCIPRDWALARVVPIHKKGDRQNPTNYRPVSLTAVPCKILESLIRDELLSHLADQDLLSSHQHGFRPRRSCSSQLLEVIDSWTRELEDANPVDVIYLDFQKAFDSVPHLRLLNKLQSYGVSGKLLAWIAAFLTNRKQQVVLDGCHSDWTDVVSGVPQGSVLGPLLFLVYVNDLPDVVHCDVKLFADDTKLFTKVQSYSDAARLQSDLESLLRWSNTWLMPFNQSKCKVLHFGHANQEFSYSMDGAPLGSTSLEKDLGVHIDPELKFREHASSAVGKATQVLAVIRRSFALLDEDTLPMLFKTLVRPHLEYGNLIWGPFNRADQRRVERVQRRATRLVGNIRQRPYEERLRLLGLPSLYYRRRRGDMIQAYQLFHGGVDVDPGSFFTLAVGSTRGHPFKLKKYSATTRVRRFAFASRIVNDWNGLPSDVVCAPSLNAFKARLDEHWAHLRFTIPDTD